MENVITPKMKRDVYTEAVRVIKKQGWTQGTLERGGPGGPVCLLGSCSVAARHLGILTAQFDPSHFFSRSGIRDELNDLAKGEINRYTSAVGWNDSLPSETAWQCFRSKRKVIRLLKKAAKVAA